MTKNIYIKSLVAFFLALTFGSCAIDDDPAIVQDLDGNNYIEFKSEGKVDYPSGSDLKVVIGKASDTKSKVNYMVTKTETDGTVTAVEEGEVIFLAGEMEQNINVTTPLLDTFTITLTDAVGLNHPEVKVGENNTLELFSLPAPSADNVVVAMINSDNSTDLWLGLSRFNEDRTIWRTDYLGSLNGSTTRVANIPLAGVGTLGAIPNSSDIGTDVLALNLFTQSELSPMVGFTIYVTMPDGTSHTFEGEIPGTRSVDNAAVKVICEEDPNNSAQKKYSFESF